MVELAETVTLALLTVCSSNTTQTWLSECWVYFRALENALQHIWTTLFMNFHL